MISVDEALAIIHTHQPAPAVEMVALRDALGKILAVDVIAPEPSPRFTNSAMDGFAVRWADVSGAEKEKPARLQLIGESQAGKEFPGTVPVGATVRISTGAMLPAGADTVVPVEDAAEQGDAVLVFSSRCQGKHVRMAGEEFGREAVILTRGVSLFPAQLALLAACGISGVKVFRRPRVATVVTGTELVTFAENPAPCQIRDSNSIMLDAATELSGGQVVQSLRVADDLAATRRAVEEAASGSDIVILTGGVSVGRHDHVREAATSAGFETLFWKVRQKPGKPLFCAKRGGTMLFGLPGNPVSAFMGFLYYIHPLLQSLSGKDFAWPVFQGILAREAANSGNRTLFLRVGFESREHAFPFIHPLSGQGSHMLTSIARADGFIILPAGVRLPSGDIVEAYPFPWQGTVQQHPICKEPRCFPPGKFP